MKHCINFECLQIQSLRCKGLQHRNGESSLILPMAGDWVMISGPMVEGDQLGLSKGGSLRGANPLHTFKVYRLSSRAWVCTRVYAYACTRVRACVCVRPCACGWASARGRGGGCVHARICRSPPNLREAKLEKVRNNDSPQALAISDVG